MPTVGSNPTPSAIAAADVAANAAIVSLTGFVRPFLRGKTDPVSSGVSLLGSHGYEGGLPESPRSLLAKTGGMYLVGLGRWFGSNESGRVLSREEVTGADEPSFAVLCDFHARPLTVDGGLLVLPILRSWRTKPVKKSKVAFDDRSGRTVLYLDPQSAFRPQDPGVALDTPTDKDALSGESGSAAPASPDHVLPAKYSCDNHSLRATVMIDATGQMSFVALVGSRYTVLQNEVIAEDAWEMMQRSELFSSTGLSVAEPRFRVVRGWNEGCFYGLSVDLEAQSTTNEGPESDLAIEMLLYHSHDTKYTYTNRIVLRDRMVEARPILALGKSKARHTKKIGDRVERVSKSLGELGDELAEFLDYRRILESSEISERESDLKKFVAAHFNTKNRDWLIDRVVQRFESEEFAGSHGRTCWTLYRAICANEGSYWDGRFESNGLPSMLEVTEAYRRRKEAMESLVSHARNRS